MQTRIIIPSRMGSLRLPGKPLADIKGKSLIRQAYDRCVEADVAPVYVAADDDRILFEVPPEARLYVNHPQARSGTDRVALAAELLGLDADDLVVNIQGDMPFISPSLIKQFVKWAVCTPSVQVGTVVTPSMFPVADGFVSCTMTHNRKALMFSRSKLPSQMTRQTVSYRHVGVYCYRVRPLLEFLCSGLSMLEEAESLEQLRFLEQGIAPIDCILTCYSPGPEVNTPEDLLEANK